jgi:phage FluMu protein Com
MMPIEFRCEGCSKLLRTPDESAGKKAKCPHCGAVVDVPAGGTAPPIDSAPTGGAAPSAFSSAMDNQDSAPNPFGPMGSIPDSDNPYASPQLSSTVQPAKPATAGELAHNKISFDDVLKTAWSITMDNLGPMAIFGVIMFGIQIALGIFGQVVNFAGQASGDPVIMGGIQILNMAINFVIQTWVGIVSILFCTRMARDRKTDLNILSQAGPHFLRAFGLTVILGGISLVFILVLGGTPALIAWITTRDEFTTAIAGVIGMVVCMIPIVLVVMNYFLSLFFIVDRREGIFAAMGQSRKFMRGNKMTAFLTVMVMNIVGGFFVLFTCCTGRIIYDPFSILVLAIMYLTATGQPFERPLK